uniref:Odorant receptor n=1 Tax=Locusta migratoria TaxID=7004 RepID=A0A0M3SBP6_LOCMI|nr:odorant receptor 118 [Locusta migratoria]
MRQTRSVESVLGSSAALLRLLGLWSPRIEDFSRTHRVLRGGLMLALSFGLMVTTLLKLVMDCPRELEELSACIFSATMLCEVFFKMVFFVLKVPTLHKLVQLLSEIRTEDSIGERNDEIRRRYQIVVDKMFLFLMATAVVTETMWAAIPLMHQLLNMDGEVTRLLPLPLWLPLDVYASPTYEVIYGAQVLLMPLTTTSLFFDFVFIDLMMRIAAELEILNYNISSVHENRKTVSTMSKDIHKLCQTVSDNKTNVQLVKNVRHHQAILRAVVLLEEAMNTGVFILFLATTIAVSSNIFTATALLQAHDGRIKALKMLSAMPPVLFEVGLYCVFGQIVINQSEKLMHSAYSCEWVDCDTRFRRSLHMFCVGAIRPLEFTVGRMYKLSRETLLQVLHGSYVMFNMLYTIQNRK